MKLFIYIYNDLSTNGKVTTGGVNVEFASTASDISDRFMSKYTDHTINSSSTNGISTNISSSMKIAGSDNSRLSYILNQMYTDGSVGTYIGASNMNTSGTKSDAQIGIINRKDGTHDYVVTQPINFLSAINVKIYDSALGGDVLTVYKNLPLGSLNFYPNSNQPANRPTGCDWGAYFIFRPIGSTTGGFIIYADNNHIACSYNIKNTATSISWHIA